MSFKEIFQQVTPFSVLCPLAILTAIIYAFIIWKEGGTSIMLMPQVLILLFLSALFLMADRVLVKNWRQTLVVIELLFVLFIYLGIAYKGRTMAIQPNESLTTFHSVYPVEAHEASDMEYVFPFSRKIRVNENGQAVFLSEQMQKNFRLEVISGGDYSYSTQEKNILGKNYTVQFYRLHVEDLKRKDDLTETEKEAVWKQIEEVLKNN